MGPVCRVAEIIVQPSCQAFLAPESAGSEMLCNRLRSYNADLSLATPTISHAAQLSQYVYNPSALCCIRVDLYRVRCVLLVILERRYPLLMRSGTDLVWHRLCDDAGICEQTMPQRYQDYLNLKRSA